MNVVIVTAIQIHMHIRTHARMHIHKYCMAQKFDGFDEWSKFCAIPYTLRVY